MPRKHSGFPRPECVQDGLDRDRRTIHNKMRHAQSVVKVVSGDQLVKGRGREARNRARGAEGELFATYREHM
jgi:hypothetical protein